MSSAVVITPVQPDEIAATRDFVMAARAQMFPWLEAGTLPVDLADFSAHYLTPGQGRFLIARCDGERVAAIGYLPYDGRFPQLDFAGRKVVEVVRLFVSPEQRRGGLRRACTRRSRRWPRPMGCRCCTCTPIRFCREPSPSGTNRALPRCASITTRRGTPPICSVCWPRAEGPSLQWGASARWIIAPRRSLARGAKPSGSFGMVSVGVPTWISITMPMATWGPHWMP